MSDPIFSKEKFKEYMLTIHQAKDKLEPEDLFVLGLAVSSSFTMDSLILQQKIKTYIDQNSIIKFVSLSAEQMIDYRFGIYTRFNDNPSSSQYAQANLKDSRPFLSQKRSFGEVEQDGIDEQWNDGLRRKERLKISEADTQDDSDSINEDMIQIKTEQNLREFYQQKSEEQQFDDNGHSIYNRSGDKGFNGDNIHHPQEFSFKNNINSIIIQPPSERYEPNLQDFGGDQVDNETMKMIESIKNQDDQEMQQMRYAREQRVNEEFICQVCYDHFNEHNIFPLAQCIHVFHKECLKAYLETQLSESKIPFKCPEVQCNKDICRLDLKNLMTNEQLEKYDSLSFNLAVDKQPDLSWCPTANCDYAFIYQEDEDNEFKCPKCMKHYCLNCKVLYHNNLTCKDYQTLYQKNQNDEDFITFAKGARLKQCPFCGLWVQKAKGCDHMICRCGKDFCYQCGGIYMKCQCYKKRQLLRKAKN